MNSNGNEFKTYALLSLDVPKSDVRIYRGAFLKIARLSKYKELVRV